LQVSSLPTQLPRFHNTPTFLQAAEHDYAVAHNYYETLLNLQAQLNDLIKSEGFITSLSYEEFYKESQDVSNLKAFMQMVMQKENWDSSAIKTFNKIFTTRDIKLQDRINMCEYIMQFPNDNNNED
jgi:hypothetical protein